mgnify:CR=1 FL=1
MSNAEYMASILKDPNGTAITLRRWYSALESAGFTERQADELTKFVLTLIITFGGQETK